MATSYVSFTLLLVHALHVGCDLAQIVELSEEKVRQLFGVLDDIWIDHHVDDYHIIITDGRELVDNVCNDGLKLENGLAETVDLC